MKLNKVKIQLEIEKFFTEVLWQLLIVFAFVFLCAWLFDKYIEAILFCISHTVIRLLFDKQYHCGTTAMCMVTTLTVAFFGIMYSLPLSVSLLSTIPVCFFIAWVGYIFQDLTDNIKINKSLTNELDNAIAKLQEYSKLDIYKMTDTELRQFGTSKGLSELQNDILIMRVIDNLKISEICKYRNYGRTTIKYHISEIKRKLGLDSI